MLLCNVMISAQNYLSSWYKHLWSSTESKDLIFDRLLCSSPEQLSKSVSTLCQNGTEFQRNWKIFLFCCHFESQFSVKLCKISKSWQKVMIQTPKCRPCCSLSWQSSHRAPKSQWHDCWPDLCIPVPSIRIRTFVTEGVKLTRKSCRSKIHVCLECSYFVNNPMKTFSFSLYYFTRNQIDNDMLKICETIWVTHSLKPFMISRPNWSEMFP